MEDTKKILARMKFTYLCFSWFVIFLTFVSEVDFFFEVYLNIVISTCNLNYNLTVNILSFAYVRLA